MGSRGMENMDKLDVAEAIQTGYTQVFNEEEGSTVASSDTSEYYELAAQVRQNFTEEINRWAKREAEQEQWDKYNKGLYVEKNNTKYERKGKPEMRDTHMIQGGFFASSRFPGKLSFFRPRADTPFA